MQSMDLKVMEKWAHIPAVMLIRFLSTFLSLQISTSSPIKWDYNICSKDGFEYLNNSKQY